MRLEEGYRWFCYQLRKPLLKLVYGRKISIGKKGKVSPSVSVRLVNKNSTMRIGNGVNIRPCTEIFSVGDGCLNIGNNVFINRGCIIGSAKSVTIEDNVTIGPNTCIYDHNHAKKGNVGFETSEVVIEKGAWIGANVCILKGCRIGADAVIGAGTVVTHNVPSGCTYIQKREEMIINN